MRQTTRQGLEALQDAPLILNPAEELLNSMSIENGSNVNSPADGSKPLSHLGSGYNACKGGRISPKHSVFVLDVKGNPLTPTTNAKARKLLKGKVAKPIWNKFSQFGIQMLVKTGKETPKTALGVDFGTKFEGYSIVVGIENNLSVMWKLPDKKKFVKKLDERRWLRRVRRRRNCRRREKRVDNRERKGFIAPSQIVMINSRLKAIKEFFKWYPIDTVALEDVRFGHKGKKYGKNFSTIEIGKKRINDWVSQRAYLQLFSGYNTEECREKYGYKKSSDKSAETFNSHCSDALALATEIHAQQHIEPGTFLVVDDTYRPIRRKLHDIQFSKGRIRYKFATGNFKSIRKRTICNFGQICGGKGNKIIRVYNWNNKRLDRSFNRLKWLSHNFKIKMIPHERI